MSDEICLSNWPESQVIEEAERGNADAQLELGNRYFKGKGVEQDYAKAAEWYEKSAEQGKAGAQLYLGRCYYYGLGVFENYFEAVKWFREAAEQGNSDAAFSLGRCYFNGMGVKQNCTEAAIWFRKTAEQGNVYAQLALGHCYEYGYGVEQDYAKAAYWYRRAAELGNEGAQLYLGRCYYQGRGVEQDYFEATEWFRKSAEQGNARAQLYLGHCYCHGRGVEQDQTEAVKWFRKSAEQGNANAQYALGNCYSQGRGVAQDYLEAAEWFRKSREQGNMYAQVKLDHCSNKGNPGFVMIDEQMVVYETVFELVKHAGESDEKHTVIVKGGPGTGKSVVAVNLLSAITSNLSKDSHNCLAYYVTRNAVPQNVYFEKLMEKYIKNNYVDPLFKGPGSFVDAERNQFTCLIVDDAHSLHEKSGFYRDSGENQIKEIINAAKVSVFFIDEEQIVTSKDIGSVAEIEKWARECGSTLYRKENGKYLELTSQLRCNGCDGYLAFIEDVLEIRQTPNADGFNLDYDIQIFDNPTEMRSRLRDLNETLCPGFLPNKTKMLAGYCYKWKTMAGSAADVYDIELENGFKARWNFGNTSSRENTPDSFDQVGCILTSQGIEFDYVGVIIGKDLRYENGHVVTDITKRAFGDRSVAGLRNHQNDELADKIIRNTYRTLLTRGRKGCYIYCEDRPLMEYLKSRVEGCIKPDADKVQPY